MSLSSNKLNTSNSSSGGYIIDVDNTMDPEFMFFYLRKYEDKIVSMMDHKDTVECCTQFEDKIRVLCQGAVGSLVSFKKFQYYADEQRSRCLRFEKINMGNSLRMSCFQVSRLLGLVKLEREALEASVEFIVRYIQNLEIL